MAEKNTAANVSAGKPKAQGAIYKAKAGTTLPTDATTPLGPEFKCLGYVSDDGFTQETERDIEDIKAWGGDTVLKVASSYSETYKYTLIEALNVEVLKHTYGDDAVEGDLASGIKLKKSSKTPERGIVVCEIALTGGYVKRIVVPQAQVTEVGEVTYKDDEAIGYETTLSAYPDSDGYSSYEYLAKSV